MGRRCCIAGCPSTSRLPEHHGVTYHSYPLDPSIRAIWLRNTRVSAGRQITKSVLVCSRHFRRADFQPQKSRKYLLKHGVFPTVFPWGKVDPALVEADLKQLKASGESGVAAATFVSETEDATKATVEATVAQIMAQTAELNAAAGIKSGGDRGDGRGVTSPMNVKFEPVTSFNPGVRLEAQDFDGVWHCARVVEVDNDDREVLIKFERSGKHKSNVVGTEEWIPMNSTRLRQKVSTKPVAVFELDEKCMARWSGPRKFPGTVKKLLGNDTYEVLFDDGYVKNVRGIHMNKVMTINSNVAERRDSTMTPSSPTPTTTKSSAGDEALGKKKGVQGQRKDWPLLDMSKLDLASLNLPEIPKDGEWTCHWVNDQPIGREGYLIVGEHRKPTVIVDDWRLPPGWVKHMYQRSNVLGKWDVILVTPNKKRFRSKADLKIYLEEQGQVYNPDIYDFSIHRRRAKDINAYVFTADYVPQQVPKPKSSFDTTLTTAAATELPSVDSAAAAAALASLAAGGSTEFIETPVATPVPPMELMTPTATKNVDSLTRNEPRSSTPSVGVVGNLTPTPGDGYVLIGGLRVQVVDNLFRCPQEGCTKNFRKENHLQIHIKHYHQDLIKLLGDCPKMQELAEKRTHSNTPDPSEPQSKTQTPQSHSSANKSHQHDVRGNRRGQAHTPETHAATETKAAGGGGGGDVTDEGENLNVTTSTNDSSQLDSSSLVDQSKASDAQTPNLDTSAKRSQPSSNKRTFASRKSSRQRITRRYLTAAQATATPPAAAVAPSESNFGVSDFEETRHSFNATPDATKSSASEAKKRKTALAPSMSVSSLDSPVTADSGSSTFLPLHAPSSNEPDGAAQPQYIKENGEIIKIVRMRQEEIINCMCSYGEEDGLMIQCELCLCWQHGVCNGIDKESDVPDKYVCYICRNPQNARQSMLFKHDQDWQYEGKLAVANYHISNSNYQSRFESLKKSHTLTGNLIELKQFMHSLRVKINIANNRLHPKLYLWAKKWDEDAALLSQVKTEAKQEDDGIEIEMKSPEKKPKLEIPPIPNIPQPEAAIDPVECQQRLMEHIKIQQNLVMNRLEDIENEINELEQLDSLLDLKDADIGTTKDVLATYIKELETLQKIGKLNSLETTKKTKKKAN